MTKIHYETAVNREAGEGDMAFYRRAAPVLDRGLPFGGQGRADRLYLKDETEDDGRRRVTIIVEVAPELDSAAETI